MKPKEYFEEVYNSSEEDLKLALNLDGKVENHYPIYISNPDGGKPLFYAQSMKDGNDVSIYMLYGKEVSAEELVEFFMKHKPSDKTT